MFEGFQVESAETEGPFTAHAFATARVLSAGLL